jgi:hypothetical protein
MARDFKRAASGDEGETPQSKSSNASGNCSAHGCTMPGSISHSVHGSNTWLCHMHFRAQVSNWQSLTSRIRNESVLVNLIKEIRMAQNGKHFDLRGWYAILENAGLLNYYAGSSDRGKSGKLSPRIWLGRLEKALYGIVMAGMDEEEKASGSSSNAESLMEQIEQFLKGRRIV